MKPPICHLCGRDFIGEHVTEKAGDLVKFADYRPLPARMVGHPHGLEWFCGDHVEAARELECQDIQDAMVILRRRYTIE